MAIVMDSVHRFLFEDLDIRGALVQLGPSWAEMNSRRAYAPPVRDLLGEMAAVTALIGSNLKAPGRLSFQLQGHGAVSMLVMDCNEKLQLRGMAKSGLSAEAETNVTGIEDLLGDGAENPPTGSVYLVMLAVEADEETPFATDFRHLEGDLPNFDQTRGISGGTRGLLDGMLGTGVSGSRGAPPGELVALSAGGAVIKLNTGRTQ